MNPDNRPAVSIWMTTSPQGSAYAALNENTHADICIIGAGIAGMTTAYHLAREGNTVAVLDDGPIGGGMTQRTTAHLSNAIDDRYSEIERLHGQKGARLAAQSHTAAIDRIETIVKEHNIECDFERLDGYLFVPPGESVEMLEKELEAAHRAGLAEVTRIERAPITTFDTGPCLRFPRLAQFHPLKYLHGLAAAIQAKGGRIFTGTHASNIEAGQQALVQTDQGYTITAGAVVVATNTPFTELVSIHTKQYPYMSYVIGARVPTGSVTRALYWDTADPYHYVRVQGVGAYDVLIVGGEDHKTGQADDGPERYARLETWARERFPMIEKIEYRWSGQVLEPADGLAFIGRRGSAAHNLYIATGDSGMGMTHGTIAGMLITDLIMERANPWAELYDPGRVSLLSLFEFAAENINVAKQYAADYVTGGEVDSAEEVLPGEGAILRQGLTKVALYRDEQGNLHERSALCRHLGCVVHWNSSEKTWDCPCHGSRFDRYGKVINGPANRNLKPREE
jgi:glycine/D-amino acid oxidase-like deaminating enzyme/nitrite reductase/ring-hydroxylating ferredoxin subunit